MTPEERVEEVKRIIGKTIFDMMADYQTYTELEYGEAVLKALKGMIGIISEDQSLPEINPHLRNCNEGCSDPYVAQLDMLNQGWRRIIND